MPGYLFFIFNVEKVGLLFQCGALSVNDPVGCYFSQRRLVQIPLSEVWPLLDGHCVQHKRWRENAELSAVFCVYRPAL